MSTTFSCNAAESLSTAMLAEVLPGARGLASRRQRRLLADERWTGRRRRPRRFEMTSRVANRARLMPGADPRSSRRFLGRVVSRRSTAGGPGWRHCFRWCTPTTPRTVGRATRQPSLAIGQAVTSGQSRRRRPDNSGSPEIWCGGGRDVQHAPFFAQPGPTSIARVSWQPATGRAAHVNRACRARPWWSSAIGSTAASIFLAKDVIDIQVTVESLGADKLGRAPLLPATHA